MTQLTLAGTRTPAVRPITAHEDAVTRALRAWRPHMTGDDYAAARVLLRDSARNLDRMLTRQQRAAHTGDDGPTEYAVAMVMRTHADLIDRYRPRTEHAGDPLAAFEDDD